VTLALPVVSAICELLVDAAIFDGEVIALDAAGVPLPFQTTMRAGRRLDVDALRHELPLSTMLFDVPHLDGVDRSTVPIANVGLPSNSSRRLAVPRTNDPAQAQAFYDVLARGQRA
jgi:DNA ligase-1